jgi:hypothetical protein
MKTTTERFVVVWFEPGGDREKLFRTEEAACRFAEQEDVLCWNPLLEHRVTVTEKTSTILHNWAFPKES